MRKRWTENEIRLLRELYSKVPTKELYSVFPNRSRSEINDKAFHLGIKKSPYVKSVAISQAKMRRYGKEIIRVPFNEVLTKMLSEGDLSPLAKAASCVNGYRKKFCFKIC